MSTFEDEAFRFLSIVEGNHSRTYNDSVGHPTIGVGFNLDAPATFARVLRTLGIQQYSSPVSDQQKQSNDLYSALRAIVARHISNEALERAALDSAIAHSPLKLSSNSFTLTDPEIRSIFDDLTIPEIAKIKAKYGGLINDKQALVLLSLKYNGIKVDGSTLQKDVLSKAIAAGWYEIRYNTNSAKQPASERQGIANRRYLESDEFSLVPDNASLLDDAKAFSEVLDPKRLQHIESYDAQFLSNTLFAHWVTTNGKRHLVGPYGHGPIYTMPQELQILMNGKDGAGGLIKAYASLFAIGQNAKVGLPEKQADGTTKIVNFNYDKIYNVAASSESGANIKVTSPQAGNYMLLGTGASQTLTGLDGVDNLEVAYGKNAELRGGNNLNVLIQDSSGGARGGDTFYGGIADNIILAQGTGNVFNISNTKSGNYGGTINVVFDGDGGNTYNFTGGAVIISLNISGLTTVAQEEKIAASLRLAHDEIHQPNILVVVNGQNDHFTTDNKVVNGAFVGGKTVVGSPSAQSVSIVEEGQIFSSGALKMYLGGTETIFGPTFNYKSTNSTRSLESVSAMSQSNLSGSGDNGFQAGSTTGETFEPVGQGATLFGLGGGDRFDISRGHGSVSVIESDTSDQPANRVVFGLGITAASVTAAGNALGDLVLSLGGGDTVTLPNALTSAAGIQSINFNDGTSLSYAQILQEADTGSAVNTLLYGDFGANIIDSKGFATYAQGNGGGDTFFYNAGYGALEIDEGDTSDNPHNVLAFGAGIDPASVGVTADGNGDLVILVSNTDQITLDSALNNADGTTYGVQKVIFADGTVWTYADLLSRAGTPSVVTSIIYGDASANVLDTHGQAHAAQGGGGGDTYVYDSGYGSLTIDEVDTSASASNVLTFGAGITPATVAVSADAIGNLLLNLGSGDLITLQNALNSGGGTTFGVQQVQFADGSAWSLSDLVSRAETGSTTNTQLYGGTEAETFDSRGIATYEQGNGGGDTFVYDLGYGALIIDEHDTGAAPSNVISFGAGITAANVQVSANGHGDVILDLGGGDRITLAGVLASTFVNGADLGTAGVQTIQFSDGTSWARADLIALADTGTATNKNLYGDNSANIFVGNSYASYERGGGGSDSFVYNIGDGALTIDELDGADHPSNVLMLGAGIDPEAVTTTVTSQGDVVLSMGEADVITLKGMAASAHAGVQTVHFADGTIWSAAQIAAAGGTLTVDPNAAAAAIGSAYYETGSYGIRDVNVTAATPNIIQTVAINGYSWAYSATVIPGSDDILVTDQSGEGVRFVDALTDAGAHFPSITFSDGTTWTYAQIAQELATPGASALFGDSSANTLDPAGSANFVQGGGGGDTFVYNTGYGAVEIDEVDAAATPANVLSLGSGITPSSVGGSADDSGNILLSFGGSDQVTIDKALESSASETNGVQQIRFSDGTVWTYADLLQKLETPTSGMAGIYGDNQANLLDTQGLTGFVQGGGGGDTFVYSSGYGALEISESDLSANPINVLALGSGIVASHVSVSTDGSGNLILNLGGGDQITIDGALNNADGTTNGVQKVTFADGTVWTAAQLAGLANAASADSSSLVGTSGADRLDSRGIASYVEGDGGGDTFVYDRGYGAVEINEADTAINPHNVLSLGAGIDPSQVTVSSDGAGNVVLDFGGTDQITLDGALARVGGTTWGVQQISFADGTTWSYADVLGTLETATGTPAIEVGTVSGSTLDGGGTASFAFGKGGGDTFVYDQGYGQLTINESDLSALPHNALAFGTGIAPADITVSADASGNILLTLDGNDGVILRNALNSGNGASYGVQSVTFSDGTTWTYAQLLAQVESGSTDNEGAYGDRQANVLDSRGLTSYAQGNGGGDTFLFNSGYGTLEINEADAATNPANTLAFGAGITASNVVVSNDGNGDIVLTLSSTDKVVLDNALNSDGDPAWGVQHITFADGTSWSTSDVLSRLAASPSSTATIGTAGADTIDASGKTYLSGGGGGDTFTFASGDGYVTINEIDAATSPDNSLVFGSGITASDVTVSADASGDLLLALSDTDVVVVRNALNSAEDTTFGVQHVLFADGTSWTYGDLLAKVEIPSDSVNGIYGDADANMLDTHGLTDYALGGGGGDTFVYDRGYGALIIDETDRSTSPSNVLGFGAGISAADVVVTSDSAGSIVLSLGGADEITIDNALNGGNGTTYGIQQVTFQDGTTWNLADLISKATVQASGGIYGDTGANTLDTHGLAGFAQGGGGGDTFVYSLKYGALEIDEEDSSASPDNVLAFGHGIDESSLVVSGDDQGDLILSLGGSDQVTLDDALTSGDGTTYGVQQITFQDGTTLSYAQLVAKAATGSIANNSIYGDGGANILDSKGLASYAAGNGGGDTFVYDSGYGALEVDEVDAATDPANVLALGAGIDPSQVKVTADANGNLILDLGGSDQITIDNALNSDSDVTYGIQRVTFADGTSWSYADLLNKSETASPSLEGIYGDGGANLLDSRGLTHFAQGGGGGDTFVYGSGYGALEIDEQDNAANPVNVLAVGTGIDPSQVTVSADASGNLILSLSGSDQITIDKALNGGDGTAYGLQKVTFADGTAWTYADLLAKADTASTTNISLYGDGSANLLDSRGLAHFEQGNGGGDTFVYDRGYGALTISETDEPGANDVLAFDAGIGPSDIAVSANGNGDILLDIGNGDVVTLKGAAPGGAAAGVLSVKFANGQSWSASQLAGFATGSVTFTPGSGSMVLDLGADPNGTAPAVLIGPGLAPSDFSVAVAEGTASDIVLNADNGDQITLRNALTSASAASEVIRFSDGTTWAYSRLIADVETAHAGGTGIYGDSAANTLDTLGLVPYASGNGGGDTFVYNSGYGATEIDETDRTAAAANVLRLGNGITPTQVTVTGDTAGDLILTMGNGDTVKIDRALNSENGLIYGVQQVQFADGTSWSYADLVAKAADGSSGTGAVYGDLGANTLDTMGLTSAFNYDIFQTAGYVQGDGGGDTIVYNSGYGAVEVNETDTSASPDNVLSMGAGITAAQISVSTAYSGGDLILRVNDGNSNDEVILDNALNGGNGHAYGVQSVVFADGTMLSPIDLKRMAEKGSYSNRALVGGTGSDYFDPAGWATTVQGNGGGDTFFYDEEYGTVHVNELDTSPAPVNVLTFGADIDPSLVSVSWDESGALTLGINDYLGSNTDRVILDNALNSTNGSTYGVQQVQFADGTVWSFSDLLAKANSGASIIGQSGADLLDTHGLTNWWNGQAYAEGRGGNDSFVFNPGYGVLEINEVDSAAAPQNVLQLGAGFEPSQVSVVGDESGNITLDFGNGDRVILDDALLNGEGKHYGVQQIRFADGTTWTYQDLASRAATAVAGNPIIAGDSGANLLDTKGLVGEAVGNGGGDTFIYNVGYGDLTISERDLSGNPHNVLILGAGIAPSDIMVSADAAGNLMLAVSGSGTVTLAAGIDGTLLGLSTGVQQIQFNDGTTWSYAEVLKLADTGSAANTVLYGDAHSEVFDSLGYATIENGRSGSDVFLYNQAYGDLTINESGGSGVQASILALGSGITPADLSVARDSASDMVLTVAGQGQITVMEQFGSGSFGIQKIVFADGGSLSQADLLRLSDTGSASNTRLIGTSAAETLDSAGYATYIDGNGGADTFVYKPGYGALEINEVANPYTRIGAILQFGPGIIQSDVEARLTNTGSLVITDGVAGDQIIVDNFGKDQISYDYTDGYGVSSVLFSDGSSLSQQQLLQRALMATSSNGIIYGTAGDENLPGGSNARFEDGLGGTDTYAYHAGDGALELGNDGGNSFSNDILRFGAGIDTSDLAVRADANGDIVMTDGVAGDSITVDGMDEVNYAGSTEGLREVDFADGSILTAQQIVAMAMIGSPTNTTIYGSAQADRIDGKGYATTEYGGGGTDVFAYNAGYGQLEINEVSSYGTSAILQIGGLLTASDFKVSFNSSGDVTLTDGIAGDEIKIDKETDYTSFFGFFGYNSDGVTAVRFSDGTSITQAELMQEAVTGSPTNLRLYGANKAEVFDTLAYATYANGISGSDTFVHQSGYGALEIDENAGFGHNNGSVLAFGGSTTPADLTVVGKADGSILISDGTSGDKITLDNQLNGNPDGSSPFGVQKVTFADGESLTARQLVDLEDTGTASNTVLHGSTGADTIDSKGYATAEYGNGGGDTFIFDQGYGSIILNETEENGAANTLQLMSNINPDDITLSTSGNDVIIQLSSGDRVQLIGQLQSFNSGQLDGIEAIKFSDGTVWDRAEIASRASGSTGAGITGGPMIAPSGPVLATVSKLPGVSGSNLADTTHGMIAFTDADVADTHTFSIDGVTVTGDDSSAIDPSVAASWLSLGLEQEPSLTASGQLNWSFVAPDDSFDTLGTNETSVITYHVTIHDPQGRAVSDDIVINVMGAGVASTILNAGDESTTVDDNGGAATTFITGKGNDHFIGRDGIDTYVYASTNSNMLVEDYSSSSSSVDTLRLTDLNASDVTFYTDRSQGEDAYIRVNATGNVIRLARQFNSGEGSPGWGIEQVVFADGETWGRQQIQEASWLYAGNADIRLDGYDYVNNTLVAGSGNDHLVGYNGSDTYIYAKNDGNLEVEDYSNSGTAIDTLKLTDLNASDVTFYADPQSADDYIRVNATGNTIRLDRQNYSGNDGPDGSTSDLGNSNYQLTPNEQNRAGNIVGTVDLSTDVVWTTRMFFGSRDDGADGISFALSGVDQQPQDVGGGSLGTLDSRSFGFKIDTHSNRDQGDPSSDFGQFVLDGNVSSSSNTFDNYHPVTNVEDGNWHDVTIAWQAATHTLSYTLNGTVIEQMSYDVIGSTLSGTTQSYFAFGAATGAYTDDQRIQVISVAYQNGELVSDVGSGGGTLVATLRPSGTNVSGTYYEITDQNGNATTDSLFAIADGNNIRVNEGVIVSDDGTGVHSLFVKTTDTAGESIVSELKINLRTVGGSYDVNAASDLTGGVGSDLFSLHSGFGSATIENFDASSGSHDILSVSRDLFADWSHLLGATRQMGSDLVIAVTNEDALTLKNVALSSFRPADVHFT